MSAWRETGPVMLADWQVRVRAREVAALAQLAVERASQGPRQDMPAARAALDRAFAILGGRDE